MPINPLSIPDPIRYSEINWSPLVELGRVFAKYRAKNDLADLAPTADTDFNLADIFGGD